MTDDKIKQATAELADEARIKTLITEIKKLFSKLEIKLKIKEADFDNFITYSPIFYDENQLWWAWKSEKKCWQLVDEIAIVNLFGDYCHLTLLDKVKFSGLISRALKLKSRQNKPKELPPYCLQFKNKIYDLQNQQEFLATPKYFLTSPIDYELSDSEETPTIDRLFVEWVGENSKENLYEILAYCCLKEQFLQSIIALTGSGSNGKGTFQNLIRKFLGEQNCVASNFKSLINRSFETSALYKKLLCIIGEVDSSDLTNTNLLKQFTGEDLIRYEFKGKTPFSETSPTTFLIATNSLPITPDKSDGFYRRWFIVDFPNQFKVQRDLLSQIPEQEFYNLTRRIVNTLLKLMKQQEFSGAGNIETKRQCYEERSNPLMMFICEFYDEDGQSCVKLREFTNFYNIFLKSKHLRQVNVFRVGNLLRAEGFEISPRKYRNEDGEIVDSAKSIIGISPKNNADYIAKNGSLGSLSFFKLPKLPKITTPPDKLFLDSSSTKVMKTTQTTEKMHLVNKNLDDSKLKITYKKIK